jgi:UDP-N-acetylglucosamine 3-dehydrogenase
MVIHMAEIRVGVVGLGQMGLHHSRVYAKMAGVRLVAICDSNEEHRAAAEKEFACTSYTNYADMLKSPDIDAVSITLPDHLHLDAAKLAIDGEKHVLLEKPIAIVLAEGKQICEMAEKSKKIFMVGHLLRYDPRFYAVKEALDSGQLGDPIHINCRRNSPIRGVWRYFNSSNLSEHVMIHDIDYVNWYFGGPPQKVFAKSRSVLLKKHNMDDVIYALLSYPNGALACLEACWVLPENLPSVIDDRMELVGTKGVAYIDSCDTGVRFISKQQLLYPDSRHWPYVDGVPSGALNAEITGFINSINGVGKPLITPREAYEALQVVDAINRSLKEGAEVSF